MSWKVSFRKSAEKSLSKIPQHSKPRILDKISALQEDPFPHGCKKLTNREEYRIRIGQYRVLYTIKGKKVIIEAIDHRKDAYR